MDDCRRAAERLTPYVDETLPPGERDSVERHLAACPPCRTAAEEERGGRTVLRECATRLRDLPPPPGLRSRCEAIARDRARAEARPWWRVRLVPAAITAFLLVFASAAILSVATRRSDAVLAAQLAADHVKCFKAFVPAGGAEADEVEAVLASQYGWDMDVPPSSEDAGVTLLGGRRCLYAEGTMPHVMYRATTGAVSLFRLDDAARGEAEVTSLGHNCRIWSRGGYTYVLVGAASAADDEMTRIARYVQAQAR